MATNGEFPHLRLEGRERAYSYTHRQGGGGEFQRPPRDRALHAEKLQKELSAAAQAAVERGLQSTDVVPLVYDMQPHALELVQQAEKMRSGIQLLNAVATENGVRATLHVPPSKQRLIQKVLNRYATEIDSRSQRPRHQDLVENINQIRIATEQDLWTDSIPYPDANQAIWWEVWLHHDDQSPAGDTWQAFAQAARQANLRVKPRYVSFPDRVVGLAYGTPAQWESAPRLYLFAAELRKAKELPTDYVEVEPRFQKELVAEMAQRLVPPTEDAPAVCLLDTGVMREHPLLAPALTAKDAQAVELEWGASDDHPQQHGTTMAGVALYGAALPELSRANDKVVLSHRLESVKLLPRTGNKDPDCYGALTQQAVARAEIAAPGRCRASCLTVTADCRDGGLPSSWSAAVDQMCFGGEVAGDPKLLVAAAGNLRDHIFSDDYSYPMIDGDDCGVEDPGQAWNALTVGAMTERVLLQHPDYKGYEPIAPAGDLAPTSRTSKAWPEQAQRGWPIKPDVVLEGGNWAQSPSGTRDVPDDLGLLTTALHPATGALLTVTRDTSPATAQAARVAAQIWAGYPSLRPETVRGLIVHSARWTAAMEERFPGNSKASALDRLRCYGYGVPSLDRALDDTSETSATLVYEGQLQPYRLDGSEIKTDEMHVHELPWPVDVLQSLGAESVTMRVTLSYFIEPSPGRRGWTRRHRYASHGLRFDLRRPTETLEAFLTSISDSALDESGAVDETSAGTLPWRIGSNTRSQGSLHSDWWVGTATELASCRHLAVYPVTGWWRERKQLARWATPARYSLIISLESAASDIYAAIANEVAIGTTVPG